MQAGQIHSPIPSPLSDRIRSFDGKGPESTKETDGTDPAQHGKMCPLPYAPASSQARDKAIDILDRPVIKMSSGSDHGRFQRLGFGLEPVNPDHRSVVRITLPRGWTRENDSENPHLSYFLDPQKRRRAEIRGAGSRGIPRTFLYTRYTIGYADDPKGLKMAFIYDRVGSAANPASIADYHILQQSPVGRGGAAELQLLTWLHAHYPSFNDPVAYWNSRECPDQDPAVQISGLQGLGIIYIPLIYGFDLKLLKRIGFQVITENPGGENNSIVVHIPDGWSFKRTVGGGCCLLLDGRGNRRIYLPGLDDTGSAIIFPRFNLQSRAAGDGKQICEVIDNTDGSIFCCVKYRRRKKTVGSTLESLDKNLSLEKRYIERHIKDFIDRYPDYANPLAYWDEEIGAEE